MKRKLYKPAAFLACKLRSARFCLVFLQWARKRWRYFRRLWSLYPPQAGRATTLTPKRKAPAATTKPDRARPPISFPPVGKARLQLVKLVLGFNLKFSQPHWGLRMIKPKMKKWTEMDKKRVCVCLCVCTRMQTCMNACMKAHRHVYKSPDVHAL